MIETMSKLEALGRQVSLERSLQEYMAQRKIKWDKCELSMSLSGRLKITFDCDYSVNYSHILKKVDWCSFSGDYDDLTTIVQGIEDWAKEKEDKLEILIWTYENRSSLTGEYE